MKMIDPPNGYRYGFPKPMPNDVTNVKEWLVENGYPKSEIDKYGEWFYYRQHFIPDGMIQDGINKINKPKTNEDES
jgi:hypothetical protein